MHEKAAARYNGRRPLQSAAWESGLRFEPTTAPSRLQVRIDVIDYKKSLTKSRPGSIMNAYHRIISKSGEGRVWMLIGISPVIGPDLLSVLHRMGHGDEIVLADAFFPGEACNARVIRADGIRIPQLLDGILALINLDSYVEDPVVMMAPVPGDALDEEVERSYRAVIDARWSGTPPTVRIERFAFYERAKKAFAVVMTGETVKYGNIILKKGVVPVRPA